VLVFLALAMATKIALGSECLIYYHHEITVIAASAAFLHVLNLPELAYLDMVAIGLGMFLAFGRMGCASVGCCYGKPARHGLIYAVPHVHAGFPAALAGVRLIPVQWIEAAAVACVTFAAAWQMWHQAPAGTAFWLYIVSYCVIRFMLEFLRGDDERSYVWGFSSAQWTSAAIWITSFAWQPMAAAVLPVAMALLGVYWRSRGPTAAWFDANHIHELAALRSDHLEPMVYRTSSGLRLSKGRSHYSISMSAGTISPARATRLADLLVRLEGGDRFRGSLVHGRYGVIHLIDGTVLKDAGCR
jgi:hypothetical protein